MGLTSRKRTAKGQSTGSGRVVSLRKDLVKDLLADEDRLTELVKAAETSEYAWIVCYGVTKKLVGEKLAAEYNTVLDLTGENALTYKEANKVFETYKRKFCSTHEYREKKTWDEVKKLVEAHTEPTPLEKAMLSYLVYEENYRIKVQNGDIEELPSEDDPEDDTVVLPSPPASTGEADSSPPRASRARKSTLKASPKKIKPKAAPKPKSATKPAPKPVVEYSPPPVNTSSHRVSKSAKPSRAMALGSAVVVTDRTHYDIMNLKKDLEEVQEVEEKHGEVINELLARLKSLEEYVQNKDKELEFQKQKVIQLEMKMRERDQAFKTTSPLQGNKTAKEGTFM